MAQFNDNFNQFTEERPDWTDQDELSQAKCGHNSHDSSNSNSRIFK